MSRFRGTITTPTVVALVAATPKTVLQAVAPANHRVALTGLSCSFDGTNATAVPVLVEVVRQTDAGTMSAAVPVKDDSSLPETLQTSGRQDASGEPTTTDVLRIYQIHPQNGYERVFGPDEEIIMKGGGRLGFRFTAPANVNVAAFLNFEE